MAIKLIGVNLKSGGLHVGRTTELTCDYLKWKQEQLYSVTWSIKYPGVKTNFFEYQADGSKSTPSSSFVEVDEESSEEQRVNVRILDDQEEEVSICCEVKVLRDSGYGSMKPLRKEKCTDIKVMAESGNKVEVDIQSSHDQVEVGQNMDLVCKAKEEHNPEPEFVIRVNGEEIIGVKRNNRLEARLAVSEEHFNPTRRSIGYRPQGTVSNTILVECLAKFGQHVADISSMTIRRGSTPDQLPKHSRDPRTFWNNPVQHRDHEKGVPCHSYILVESSFNQGAVIRGQISGEVLEDINSPTKTAENRLETSTDAVTVLNTLGYHGYKVVGVGNSMDNRMVWTLERKYYEFHKDEL